MKVHDSAAASLSLFPSKLSLSLSLSLSENGSWSKVYIGRRIKFSNELRKIRWTTLARPILEGILQALVGLWTLNLHRTNRWQLCHVCWADEQNDVEPISMSTMAQQIIAI